MLKECACCLNRLLFLSRAREGIFLTFCGFPLCMNDIAQEVRTLGMYSAEMKQALGGPMYSESIERELKNYLDYTRNNIPNRARFCVGSCIFGRYGEVIGYQSTTILQAANPFPYEREHMKLNGPLTYVQGKKILVHPMHARQGHGSMLLSVQLGFACDYDLDFVTDVRADNKAVINLLNKHDIKEWFSWKTRSGTEMYRMGIAAPDILSLASRPAMQP